MELDRLYVFQAVAQEGSIVGGARLLKVSAASVSRSIHLLENELGIAVIERNGRSVRLTDEGALFGERVQTIVEQVERLRLAVEEVIAVQGGSLHVGCTTALATGCVVEAVERFVNVFSQVKIVFHSDERSASVVDMIADGLCEVGFIGEDIHERSVIGFPVGKEQLVVVGPRTCGMQEVGGNRNGVIWLGELELGPWISGPVGSSLREPLERAFGGLGMRPRVVVETDHRDMVPGLVFSGAGFALLPRRVAEELRLAGATIIDVRPAIEIEVALVYKGGMLSSLGEAFIEVVKAFGWSNCAKV